MDELLFTIRRADRMVVHHGALIAMGLRSWSLWRPLGCQSFAVPKPPEVPVCAAITSVANQLRQLSSTAQTASRPLATAGRSSKIFLLGWSHRRVRIQRSGMVTVTGEAEE